MVCTITGEVRSIQVAKDQAGKELGYRRLGLEQVYRGAPEILMVNTRNGDSQKVGDKVTLQVTARAGKTKRGDVELWVWEQEAGKGAKK